MATTKTAKQKQRQDLEVEKTQLIETARKRRNEYIGAHENCMKDFKAAGVETETTQLRTLLANCKKHFDDCQEIANLLHDIADRRIEIDAALKNLDAVADVKPAAKKTAAKKKTEKKTETKKAA